MVEEEKRSEGEEMGGGKGLVTEERKGDEREENLRKRGDSKGEERGE